MSHLFPTGENKSWIIHQNERRLSIWMKKKLGNHQGIQEEIQPLSQSDYQSLSSEIPPRDDCLDLRRWIQNTDTEEYFWKGFRNTSWLSWLRKISQRMKGNFKRRFKNFSPKILKCEKSISFRWKKQNRSIYAYFCTENKLVVNSLSSIAITAIKLEFRKNTW